MKSIDITESDYYNTLEKKNKEMENVLRDIAESSFCTGDDAVNYQHWAHQILKEMEVMDD